VTGNYSDTSGTVNDKINKADADCSSIAGYTVTYDGNAHTATGSCKGVDGLDLAGLDLSGTTHTAAGTYDDDPWTFTDVTGNYSDTSGTVNDKINKADADCSSIAGYTVTYDGNAHTATGSCKGVDGLDLAGLDLSGTTHTAAGTYDDDPWTFTDVTGNYSDTSGTVNDTINKADLEHPGDLPGRASPTRSALSPCTGLVQGARLAQPVLAVSGTRTTPPRHGTASATTQATQPRNRAATPRTSRSYKAPSNTQVTCPTSVVYTGSALSPCTASVTGAGGLSQSLSVGYSNNTNGWHGDRFGELRRRRQPRTVAATPRPSRSTRRPRTPR
jgi:hypothetical protein